MENIIQESNTKINKFIEEEYHKCNFMSLTPDEQHTQTLAMVKKIMEQTFVLPLDMLESISIPEGSVLKKKSARLMPDGSYNKKTFRS